MHSNQIGSIQAENFVSLCWNLKTQNLKIGEPEKITLKLEDGSS